MESIARSISHTISIHTVPPPPSPVPEKPSKLPTLTKKQSFVVSTLLVISNFLQVVSFLSVFGGPFHISSSLGSRTIAQASWIAASYPLTQGVVVTISGRIGSRYGHKNILVFGGAWWTIFTFVNIFCNSPISFAICRAFTGLGGGLIVPDAVAIIGITLPPGLSRNMSLGWFEAAGPVGGYLGFVLAGLFVQLIHWKWLFVFLGVLGVIHFTLVWWIAPPDEYVYLETEKLKLDYLGGCFGIIALILFSFVWIQAPLVGWREPYEIALLFTSIFFFILTAFHSSRIHNPFFPLDIWSSPSFAAVIFVALFSLMSFGINFWYATAWLQLVRHFTILEFAVAFTPSLVGGLVTAVLTAWMIRRFPAQWVLAFGSLATLGGSVLLATMPEQQSYWIQTFPALFLMSLCPDLIFTAAQIIACNSVKRHEQGLAGSLVGALQLYGTSIGLGFAGTVEVYTAGSGGSSSLEAGGTTGTLMPSNTPDDASADEVRGYRSALYFSIGVAAAAIIIDLLFCEGGQR